MENFSLERSVLADLEVVRQQDPNNNNIRDIILAPEAQEIGTNMEDNTPLNSQHNNLQESTSILLRGKPDEY